MDLMPLDPSYKVFYPDGDCVTVFYDSQKTKQEIEKIEPGSSDNFDKFIDDLGELYKVIEPLLYKCFQSKDILNPSYWPLLTKLKAFDTYWGLASKYFKSDRLRYLFTFEAMFMGVSPYRAPAFYSIISYTDHAQKIFHPRGGMYEIAKSLERIAKEFGAKFNYSQPVASVSKDNGKFKFDILGSNYEFDEAVINADYAYAQKDLLKRKIKKYQYSCSVYLMYLGLNRKVPGLAHHNLFFSGDLRKNLSQIFNEKVQPQDPSFYIHVPTVTDPSLAPEGKDIFYVLVPVPNLNNNKDDMKNYEQRIRRHVFDVVRQKTGQSIEDAIEIDHAFYPEDFIGRYNIHNGATFGLSHNLMQSAFFRPANVDSKLSDLYYVGASTQPGGGLPVVIAGSRIVADLINKD